MGRPLFSKAFQTEPVVREPEPSCPYQKWSHINPFDPDSDEFFENDEAVYEAFIEHVAVEQSEDEEEVERDTVVVRMGNASPISSEDSLSDRDSPMATGADDPAQHIAYAYLRQLAETNAPVGFATRDISGQVQAETPVESFMVGSSWDDAESPDASQSFSISQADLISDPPNLRFRDELPHPPTSAPIPVPTPRYHRSASVEDITLPSFYHQNSPMTPPSHSGFHRFSPSPPPTVSPRIYTWASRRQPYSSTGTSPFTSTTARMSHAHLSPAIVRVHSVMT